MYTSNGIFQLVCTRSNRHFPMVCTAHYYTQHNSLLLFVVLTLLHINSALLHVFDLLTLCHNFNFLHKKAMAIEKQSKRTFIPGAGNNKPNDNKVGKTLFWKLVWHVIRNTCQVIVLRSRAKLRMQLGDSLVDCLVLRVGLGQGLSSYHVRQLALRLLF